MSDTLPNELMAKIAEHLDGNTVLNLRKTCSEMKDLVDSTKKLKSAADLAILQKGMKQLQQKLGPATKNVADIKRMLDVVQKEYEKLMKLGKSSSAAARKDVVSEASKISKTLVETMSGLKDLAASITKLSADLTSFSDVNASSPVTERIATLELGELKKVSVRLRDWQSECGVQSTRIDRIIKGVLSLKS